MENISDFDELNNIDSSFIFNNDLISKKDEVEFELEETGNVLDGLNIEQVNMVNSIREYLTTNSENRPYFTVQGGGGTGKSYTIKRAISHIPNHQIIAAAPSHFAKNVLQNFLGDEYKTITIAVLLGKKITYNDEGEQILVNISSGFQKPIYDYDVILIDEISMIDDDIAGELLSLTKFKKLILLGDYCQLPPVLQDHDAVFFNDIGAELTIPMRFTGSLYKLSNMIREEIYKIRDGIVPSLNILNTKTDRVSKLDSDGSGYIFLNNVTSVINASVRRFKKYKGINYVRVLAYRNNTVRLLNKRIRQGIFGKDLQQFEKGELVINKGGYSKNKNKQGDSITINNGEIFRIRDSINVNGPHDIPCVQLFFEDVKYALPVLVVSTEGLPMYDRIFKRLNKIAKNDKRYWKDFYNFKDSFAYFDYSYATSIHKAQGSTITHTFIMEDDIMTIKPITNKEKLQSLYVAISRASFRVYVYNKKFKTNMTQIDKKTLKLDKNE